MKGYNRAKASQYLRKLACHIDPNAGSTGTIQKNWKVKGKK